MSEWIRHRGSKSMPKCLEGKRFEVRYRDGVTYELNSALHQTSDMWTHDGVNGDIMAYKIVGDITTPNYSKGFPKGTTAKDIGAKKGDEFVVVKEPHDARYKNGDVAELVEDDFSVMPFFLVNGKRRCIAWHRPAPIPPKTAIQLQAEEVGIPEPVQLVDSDGWIEWKGGECPVDGNAAVEYKVICGWESIRDRADTLRWSHIGVGSDITAYRLHQPQEWPEDRVDIVGQNGNDGLHYDKEPDADEPIGKRVADAMFAEIMKRQPSAHLEDDLLSAASRIKWESVFGLRDIADAARNVGVEIKFESLAESNKYQRTIKGVTVDVYDVLAAFGVTCQARGHAIKKLLMAGQRGHKDEAQDLREAVQAIERSIELTSGGES